MLPKLRGHGDIGLTLYTYDRVLPGIQEDRFPPYLVAFEGGLPSEAPKNQDGLTKSFVQAVDSVPADVL